MDKKSTKVGMSLYDYEHLKECQKNYKDLVNNIKSIAKPAITEGRSVEIKIDKAALEKLLFNFIKDDLGSEHMDFPQTVFVYK
ncbi:MAG: hypothetical protein ACM3MK_03250 [Chitinophagales bacterium]